MCVDKEWSLIQLFRLHPPRLPLPKLLLRPLRPTSPLLPLRRLSLYVLSALLAALCSHSVCRLSPPLRPRRRSVPRAPPSLLSFSPPSRAVRRRRRLRRSPRRRPPRRLRRRKRCVQRECHSGSNLSNIWPRLPPLPRPRRLPRSPLLRPLRSPRRRRLPLSP